MSKRYISENMLYQPDRREAVGEDGWTDGEQPTAQAEVCLWLTS
jgi:hypothetical protein